MNAHASQFPVACVSPACRVEAAGAAIVRWSIVFLLLAFGSLKCTAAEADAITPFVVNSPMLRWMPAVFGHQGTSNFIGVLELSIAALIALRRWAPRCAIAGGFLGTAMFATTLSFILTTPGLGGGAAFLVKDLPLLGGALWTAGESWAAIQRRPRQALAADCHRSGATGNDHTSTLA